MKSLIKEIQNSGLFDADWYVQQYPDVEKSKLSPIVHYLKLGHKLNRRPSRSLDIVNYLKSNPDAIACDINPLLHYIRYGKRSVEDIENSTLALKNKSFINEYFDNVYVVNLEHKTADRLKVAHHLKQHNIEFELFIATNGYSGEPLKHYEKYSSRQLGCLSRYSKYNQREIEQGSLFLNSAGAFGYIYTYVRILNDAKAKGYKRILILEDDIILTNDFEREFKRFTQSIDANWKVLQLGASQYGWSSVNFEDANRKGYYFPRAMDTKGSFAIAFDASVVDEIVDSVTSFEAPFDHAPMGEIYEKYLGKCFVAYPYIIIPDVSESSIRGSRCQFSHSKRMKWPLENFKYPLSTPSIAVIINSKLNLKYYEKFSSASELPFRLRIYFNTADGLRPLHNTGLLEIENNQLLPINESTTVLQADYVVTIGQNDYLIESDIIEFIQSKLNLSSKNSTPLREVDIRSKNVVKDRVSVIIPTYKRPKNLNNALISVVNQDYDNVEIIVVSDNGNNSEFNKETKEIIDSFKKSHPHRKLIYLEHCINRNGSAARNTGIAYSTGEYISFLDDDDIYLQGRLSKSVESLKDKTKKIGAVYCGFLGWNSPENDLNRYKVGDLTYEVLALDYKRHYLHTNTATYRRDAILDINGFDESYRRHQDLEFNLRFFEKYEVDAVKECLVYLNPEPSGVSNKVFDMAMLELKQKFLGQFTYLIEKFSAEQQEAIFSIHQVESLKYVKEKGLAFSVYKDNYKDYRTQIVLKLLDGSKPNSNASFGLVRENGKGKDKDIGFYRVIGNNIPGLHSKDQSYENLKFIIENEPDFCRAVKYFVLNRIIDDNVRMELIELLEHHGYRYLEIDFDYQEFKKIGYDFGNLPDSKYWFGERTAWQRLAANSAIRASKNRYLMNNNGARNFALNHGRKRYAWTMPWDGNCYLSKPHYDELERDFSNPSNNKYIITPMERLSTNDQLGADSVCSNPTEEPQISFSCHSIESFNEERVYGNQPKVELFKRIGAAGIWDEYVNLYPWKKLEFNKSTEFGMVSSSSAVFRLFSGNVAAIEARNRTHTRANGLVDFIDEIETYFVGQNLASAELKKNFLSYLSKSLKSSELININKNFSKIFSSSMSSKDKESKFQSLLGDIQGLYIASNDYQFKLECALIIFGRNLNRKKKILNAKIINELDSEKFSNLDAEKLSNLDVFMERFIGGLSSILLKLSCGKYQGAVKGKVDIVLMMYFFSTSDCAINEELRELFKLTQYLFNEFFEYDCNADLNGFLDVL